MIIDIYTHLAPRSFLAKMNDMSPTLRNVTNRLLNVKALYDLDVKFRTMDTVENYRQVISLPNPSLEECTSPEQGASLLVLRTTRWLSYVRNIHPDLPGLSRVCL